MRLAPLGVGLGAVAVCLARGLCGERQRPNLFQKLPKGGLRCHTHGSIRVQEGAR